MKIVVSILTEAASAERDYSQCLKIEIDGKQEFMASDGDPEDSTLSRNFSDCHGIISMIKRAYDAGKNGESFEYEAIEVDEM